MPNNPFPQNPGGRPPQQAQPGAPQQPPRPFVQEGFGDGPDYDPAKGPPSYGPYAQSGESPQNTPPTNPPPNQSTQLRSTQPPHEPPPLRNMAERAEQVANLAIECEQVESFLCGFLRSEIYRAGFKRAVLGLSGGLDSSIVAYLAAIALGPENVLAVTMPYKTSSEATRRDSQQVIERLGVETIEVPITAQVDAYFEQFPSASPLRRANKCARERMAVLYDQSASFEGLVLGTTNKSELLLGYCTQFGDLAAALSPLGDLYKTQLYPLGEHLGVPQEILTKQPTGDLWIGQTDEEELGFSYAAADRLLCLLVDHRWQLPELLAAGYEQALIDRVAERIRRNHFKRRLPIIAMLSQRKMERDDR